LSKDKWHHVHEADINRFVQLVTTDPVIQAFHAHDVCCQSSDKYLLAMVFVYFKRAQLEHSDYTRLNFFTALYLAHEIEEEREDDRWELLPWALGKNWRKQVIPFIRGKNEFWQRMNFQVHLDYTSC
jgi:speedy protein